VALAVTADNETVTAGKIYSSTVALLNIFHIHGIIPLLIVSLSFSPTYREQFPSSPKPFYSSVAVQYFSFI